MMLCELILDFILMYKTAFYTLDNGVITQKKQQISKSDFTA